MRLITASDSVRDRSGDMRNASPTQARLLTRRVALLDGASLHGYRTPLDLSARATCWIDASLP